MGTCYNIIITWKQKIPLDISKKTEAKLQELSEAIKGSFKEDHLGSLYVRSSKLGSNYFIFTWCEHDDEYDAFIGIIKELDYLQNKGIKFESCFFDNLDNIAFSFSELKIDTKKLDIIDKVFKKIKNIAVDDWKNIKKLHTEFDYSPNNLSKETVEKVFDLSYFKLPTGERSPFFYLKDNKIFFGPKVLPQADIKSFQVIEEFIAKDKKRVYFTEHITGANPGNISTHMNIAFPRYFSDEKNVYYHQYKMDADLASFKVLGSRFSKDKDHVFFLHKILPGADPRSFIVSDIKAVRCGYDKTHVFIPEKKLKIKTTRGDKWTLFARENSGYLISADNSHIFENEKSITDFGLNKMKITGTFTSRVIITSSGTYRFWPNKKRGHAKDRFDQLFEKID